MRTPRKRTVQDQASLRLKRNKISIRRRSRYSGECAQASSTHPLPNGLRISCIDDVITMILPRRTTDKSLNQTPPLRRLSLESFFDLVALVSCDLGVFIYDCLADAQIVSSPGHSVYHVGVAG